MNRVYVSGKLEDELQIKQLRNYIWVATNASEYYKKKDPHITIVPAFDVPDQHLSKVKEIINQKRFKGEHIDVNTLSVYENIHKPYVVQLDAEHSMHSKIQRLIRELQPYAERDIRDPPSPHITLFKTQGWWDTVPDEVKVAIQFEVMSNVGIRDTEIRGVKTEVR